MTSIRHLTRGRITQWLMPIRNGMAAMRRPDDPVGTCKASCRQRLLGRCARQRLALVMLIACGFGLLTSGCALRSGRQPRHEVTPLYPATSVEFQQAAGTLLGSSFVSGNSITTLANGREIFPAMLGAIRAAKHSINFETYIFYDDRIGREFTAALAERARAGVKVCAVLDAQGTRTMGAQNEARLREAGVEVVKYHSAKWLDPRRYNNRSHRKLLIVDGRIGFIGGVGIADEWSGNADSPQHWRDNHYKVTGPVVAQLQATFMAHWLETHGDLLHGTDYFPPLASTGAYLAQSIRSSKTNANLDLMYLLAIASAQKTLRIENAYFLPDDLTRLELISAARRGVKVEVVMPGNLIDQKLVRSASQRHWPELLEAGVKMYEYQPTMMHVKLMIVDDYFVSVGSGNFDKRSITHNDEANLNVLNRSFAAEQLRLFDQDKQRSRAVSLAEVQREGLWRLLHHAAGLTASQL
jgi:cardiolipin synthase